MKLGIFSWYGYNTPIPSRLQRIKEAGFDTTMLWWDDALEFKELTKAELVNTTRAHQLIIENIHVPFVSANDLSNFTIIPQ